MPRTFDNIDEHWLPVLTQTLAVSKREGACLLCSQKTPDWWYLDGATKMCKCHACLQKGLA